MKLLIVGSTGMLGQALMIESQKRGYETIGISRNNSTINVNIKDINELKRIIMIVKPEIVINTAAIVDLNYCEDNPCEAYKVNARSVAVMSELCYNLGSYFIQISTDHYYSNEGDKKHKEDDPIILLNEYARTKYAAERFTLLNEKALVIRTNIVGLRGQKIRPTFMEWVVNSFQVEEEITLFDDFYTSSIDVTSFSNILFDLIEKRVGGVYNIASNEVFSKRKFIEAIGVSLGYSLHKCRIGSVKTLHGIRRGDSLGLDVNKIETILSKEMPSLNDVINSLVYEIKERYR